MADLGPLIIGCCIFWFVLNAIFMSVTFSNVFCTSAGGGLCYRKNYDCGECDAASCKAATPAAPASGTSTYAAEPAATQPAVVGYGSDDE
jgi:hypothetical protein